MRSPAGLAPALALLSAMGAAAALEQARPTPVPTLPTVVAPQRLSDPPVIPVLRLPSENPFGAVVESPPALPAKPVFPELSLSAPFFAALRLDRAGKVTQSRRVRDPIPSLSADSKKSFERWVFEPARKAGQPVETWTSVRLDLQVEVKPPRIEQIALTPVTPSSPIPTPLEWGNDAAWYENAKAAAPADGAVPLEQVDTPPNPKKTKWDADSYKGPFSCRFWVKVDAAGRIEKAVPLQVSDPVLIGYVRRAIASWTLRPARIKVEPVESWNDLSMNGQISYSVEVKQIANLRKSIAGS